MTEAWGTEDLYSTHFLSSTINQLNKNKVQVDIATPWQKSRSYRERVSSWIFVIEEQDTIQKL